MKRRHFLQTITLLSGTAYTLSACKPQRKIGGKIVGASANIGHLLRDKTFGEPAVTEQKEVVIIGGGISGLSAARHLHRSGVTDVVILDLEEKMGGNAASGSNAVSAYPWGAHYVPTPNNNLTEYIQFLQDCGVVTFIDETGLPTYNELYLCFDPQERLYINGRWQEGLVPQHGVPEGEAKQIKQFMGQMNAFRYAKGSDGREAFAIPVDASSKDETYVQLDRLTMKEWLQQNGYTSPCLHWYVNYCTRDDFGTTYDVCSAWAGVHYFAGRKGRGTNAEYHDVLTWPQGNGFLVQQLLQPCLRPQSLVVKVVQTEEGVTVNYYDVLQQQLQCIRARHCLLAVPQFVAARLLNDAARMQTVQQHLHYAPWMVANFTVQNLPERSGAPLSWDNVLYGSASLGYVAATHELTQQLVPRQNLTYYYPLTEGHPTEERQRAQQRTHEEWVGLMVNDLEKVHPGIGQKIDEVDIMVWGHAMAQPRPGLMHGEVRKSLATSIGNRIHFAHTDLAGISIFEEAFYQGLAAAKNIIIQMRA
jgi:hypothetical protein